MRLFQAALQHGPGNPIIVEDDEIVEDSTIDPGEQWVGIVEDEGHLVPIENEDEDPRDPSRLVDRVMEREELRQRRLTMDDQAW